MNTTVAPLYRVRTEKICKGWSLERDPALNQPMVRYTVLFPDGRTYALFAKADMLQDPSGRLELAGKIREIRQAARDARDATIAGVAKPSQ